MRRSYDILVVGAGPAGSMAAKRAAEEGAQVLLIENHSQIGIPTLCGEGISTQGLTQFFNPSPTWVASEVVGAIFNSPSGRRFKVHHPEAGFILERKLFDRDLAHLASEAGAEVRVGAQAVGLVRDGNRMEGVKVLYRGNQAEVKAKVVIGADGVSSSVGRWAGLDTALSPSSIHICAQLLLSGVEVELGYAEFFLGNSIAPGGYGWIFPKKKGLANVGIGVFPPRAKKTPRAYLDDFVKVRFPDASILESITGAVPTTPLKKVRVANVMLVGDAARVADPISGAGIANSLLTGEIAGRIGALAVKNVNPEGVLKKYQKEVTSALGKELEYRRKAKQVWLKLTDKDLETIFDFGSEAFGERTVTEIRPQEIVASLVRSSPRFLKLARHLL